MIESVQNFQELKTRLEIDQIAWKITQMSDIDVERLADALYNSDSRKAMDLMNSISVSDMEYANKYSMKDNQ